MPLSVGDTLGPYEILALIGKGGMGEVYRARDTRLKRDVAIKVLPGAFARDPERMARLQREAEVLASLNHTNIATMYGIEDHALVMEMVEGESPKGPLPFDDAWKIASQIVAALEYAHANGIVHRDLKPANIKITPDGVVKLLDFGLAKAFTSQRDGPVATVENSPTLTMGATEVGVILGTAAYMAPEQARGKAVDKRADIWAFGVVLYELLTGVQLFQGEDAAEILAHVVTARSDLSSVPSEARALIEACLQKDPKQRLKDIGDAHRLLAAEVPAAPAPVTSASRPWLATVAAASLFAITTGALAWVHFREPPAQQASTRFQVTPPGTDIARFLTVSPDGHMLAFVANNGGSNQIWIRSFDALESRALPGTEGAIYPFWSPDSGYLGFFADGKLKKIGVNGGPVQSLADAATGRGGSWNRDGVIIFSAGPTGPILRVFSAGGTPAPVTKLREDSTTTGHRFPAFLPDGIHFLYTGSEGVLAGSLHGDAPLRVLPDDSNALYMPPGRTGGAGSLLFRREAALMTQPFDPRSLQFAGDPVVIAERVAQGANIGFGAFSASPSGTLVYAFQGSSTRELVWMDRNGKRLATVGKSAAYETFSLSPDEKTVAVEVVLSNQKDTWLVDITRGVASRFTFLPGLNGYPLWSPDGTRVVFSLQPRGQGTVDIYQKPASGNGAEQLLLRGAVNTIAQDWSPDGKWIIYRQSGTKTASDLWLLPLEGEHKPVPYVQTSFDEVQARFSPDSKWMAYTSNESGQFEVYVQAVPASGAKYQVSATGGRGPLWRRDGRELYYISADQKLMAVPVNLSSKVELGAPQTLFQVPPMGFGYLATTPYAPSRDGQRFLVNVPAGGEAAAVAPPITVVLNWQAGLKK